MPAPNTTPIFSLTPKVTGVPIGAQRTTSDGSGTIGTDMWLAYTAGSNGSWVSRIRFSPTASIAATATSATVLRVYVSSQTSGATLPANTWLISETSAGAQTADQTTTGTFYFEVPLGFALPANYTILVSTHIINATNTAWVALVFGGDY